MTPHRILNLNALSTAACAAGLVLTRGWLYTLFGLGAPLLLDLIALGLFGYAVALASVARRPPVSRQALLVFTAADVVWVAVSAIVLVLFWSDVAPIARVLIVACALVVEVLATLQFRAAGGFSGRTPQTV